MKSKLLTHSVLKQSNSKTMTDSDMTVLLLCALLKNKWAANLKLKILSVILMKEETLLSLVTLIQVYLLENFSSHLVSTSIKLVPKSKIIFQITNKVMLLWLKIMNLSILSSQMLTNLYFTEELVFNLLTMKIINFTILWKLNQHLLLKTKLKMKFQELELKSL